jgi:hypothetical protein
MFSRNAKEHNAVIEWREREKMEDVAFRERPVCG